MENEFSIVFNVQSANVEVVTEIDPLCHKLITTKKELLEVAAPLVLEKPIAEVAIELALWLVGKIDLGKHYFEIFWDSLPPFLKDLGEKSKLSITPPTQSITRKVIGLESKHILPLLGRLDALDNLDQHLLKTRIMGCLHAADIYYVWQLSFYSHGTFNDLFKLRNFGHKLLNVLRSALAEELGENYKLVLDSLGDFLNEILDLRKCEEVPEIRDSREYQYLKGVLKKDFFDRYNRLKNFYDLHHGAPLADVYFLAASPAQRDIDDVTEAMEFIEKTVGQYLTQAIREAVQNS